MKKIILLLVFTFFTFYSFGQKTEATSLALKKSEIFNFPVNEIEFEKKINIAFFNKKAQSLYVQLDDSPSKNSFICYNSNNLIDKLANLLIVKFTNL